MTILSSFLAGTFLERRQACHSPLTTIIKIFKLLYLTIILQERIGYDMVDGQQGAMHLIGYNHLICGTSMSGIIGVLKMPPKYRKLI